MLSGKPNITSSDSSSGDETDQPENNTGGVGRSYECSFCKRGFTNAQALGGHMNIHRKDKAKAKKKDIINISSSPKSSSSSHEFTFPASHHEQQRIYSSSLGSYMRCQLYFPGPTNPNHQLHDRFGLGGLGGLGSSMMMKKDHQYRHHHRIGDQSLSLRIGSNTHMDDHVVVGADHVDLELRLGQHP